MRSTLFGFILMTLLLPISWADEDGGDEIVNNSATGHNCAQIDPTNVDTDGMPFCPTIVQTVSAFSVYNCALQQAKTFHAPTDAEKKNMTSLLTTFKESTIAGISKVTTKKILSLADSLGLQACRVTQTVNKANDSYLLLYSKPGVADYSGPFMMLRETKASKIVIISPHDDSDGTYADTKEGLAHSNALACISNGHMRGHVGTSSKNNGDFVHNTNNLGTFVVQTMGKLFPGYVVLHIHGWANPTKVLVDSRNPALYKAFETAIVDNSRVPQGNFSPLRASFSIDTMVNTNYYLKTEMPAVIHEKNHMIISDIAKEIEKYSWAWPTAGE
jgi:hypothetical protein